MDILKNAWARLTFSKSNSLPADFTAPGIEKSEQELKTERQSVSKARKYFDEFNMLWSDESPIDAKEGRLVAIAVSAAIRCEYCIAAQIEFAKKAGATDDEIKAAIQIAAEIQRFSTLLYGNEFDVETFNKIIGRDNKE